MTCTNFPTARPWHLSREPSLPGLTVEPSGAIASLVYGALPFNGVKEVRNLNMFDEAERREKTFYTSVLAAQTTDQLVWFRPVLVALVRYGTPQPSHGDKTVPESFHAASFLAHMHGATASRGTFWCTLISGRTEGIFTPTGIHVHPST